MSLLETIIIMAANTISSWLIANNELTYVRILNETWCCTNTQEELNIV